MSGAKLFNFVRQNASGNFKEVVPEATDGNISDIANILFNDAYQPLLNEFVSNLINRIGLTIIRNKSYNNPLSILKKGSTPLGTDIQDLYENPAEAEQYAINNAEMAKLLTITDPDTKVAYYRRNRKDLYTKTIAREALQGAFVSWTKFEGYIGMITQSLYSGCYIDEFKYTKGLVEGAFTNNKAIYEKVSAVTDASTAEAFVLKARDIFDGMTFPSENYNAYSKMSGDLKKVTTWTDPSRIVLLIRSDVLNKVSVKVLAAAFNMKEADFMGRVIKVDKFDDANKVLGVICDEAFFQIYDNIFRFDEFYNARTMCWNEYLHVWETFAICPFANAVIFATDDPSVPATDIDVEKSSVSVEAGKTVTVIATPTPINATSAITASSSAEGTATVAVSGRYVTITGVEAGSATITVSCNGHTDTISVTVTAVVSE